MRRGHAYCPNTILDDHAIGDFSRPPNRLARKDIAHYDSCGREAKSFDAPAAILPAIRRGNLG
jgi:hypothetical protein